ncbi:fatty acid--CoA ligase family protein [Bacillus sp. FJAT-47783]|uniref:fatty acid--CoA ligase family protein n=1 Tax=Bacillus sp. FJAT-47783 TaxID=2922712 RepID=UPI001FAE211E|nr:fatty acid--CoA ligase family protein [Bacillus sp. FJAT-47783]
MNLVERLKEVTEMDGEKIAYIFQDQSYTYKKLEESINRFADSLTKLGVNKGDHIALLLGNSPHFVISLYGALKVGATVIPVNPTYTSKEIGYILNNGDVKLVITIDKLLPLFETMNEQFPKVVNIVSCPTSSESIDIESFPSLKGKLEPFTSLVANGSPHYEGPTLQEDDVAVILYTSGTTGKPKGAMLTHKNVFSNAADVGAYLQMNYDDKVIAALPMFHVFCLTVALNGPLMAGATVIIVPKFSPAEIFRLVKTYKATVFAGVPTMYNFLLQYEDGEPSDLQSLKLCISGGASMPVALLNGFEKKFNVRVSEGYGLSEASPVTTFNPLDRPRKAGSIGTSILHVENKVVNELGEEVAPGEVGELTVRGPNVMKGYYKMPEETAHALRDGWLYTGDLAKKDEEGYFYIVDRKKDLILVGGYNVYPREVEEVLYDHPDVVEAAVIGIPDPEYGEAVKCFVVSKNKGLTEDDLLQYCSDSLAKYKIPRSIEFLEELPKNTTGKILRRALKDQLVKQ